MLLNVDQSVGRSKQLIEQHLYCEGKRMEYESKAAPLPGLGVLDEPYSFKHAQGSSYTGPSGYIGWTRVQPMTCRLAGLYDNSAERA